MVTDAVAELNGVTPEEPIEITIDLPENANLPEDYVPSEAARLEAYRRLAAVTSDAEVDDIRADWRDRYGPIPENADRLLDAALLRADCHRLGVRDVVTVKGPGMGGPAWIARLGPLQLKVSQEMRLSRLFPDSVWKPTEYGADGGQIQLGIKKKREIANAIRAFLAAIYPPDA